MCQAAGVSALVNKRCFFKRSYFPDSLCSENLTIKNSLYDLAEIKGLWSTLFYGSWEHACSWWCNVMP